MASVASEELRRQELQSMFVDIGGELSARNKIANTVNYFGRQSTWDAKRVVSGAVGCCHNPGALDRVERQLDNMMNSDKLMLSVAYALYEQDKNYYYRHYNMALQEIVEGYSMLMFARKRRIPTFEEVQEKLTVQLVVNVEEEVTEIPEEPVESNESLVPVDSTEFYDTVAPQGTDLGGTPGKVKFIKFAIPITKTDYYLGLSDVPGELVRACAAGVHRKDFKKFLYDSLFLVRGMYQAFSRLMPYPYRFHDKLSVMRNSLCKLELACYHSVTKSDRFSHVLQSAMKGGSGYQADDEDSGFDILNKE